MTIVIELPSFDKMKFMEFHEAKYGARMGALKKRVFYVDLQI